jgi:hypothetical protein
LPIAPPLASALQGVKLRSAPLCPHRDEHAGAAALTASATLAAALQTEREHNARLRAVDLESWYDSISDKTFKTIFLPLAPNEARCIAQEYHRKIARAASAATQDISSYVHDVEDDTCLLQLQARISDALTALGGHGECQALRALGDVVILVLPLPSSHSPTQLFVHLLQLLSSSRVVAPKTRALVSSVLLSARVTSFGGRSGTLNISCRLLRLCSFESYCNVRIYFIPLLLQRARRRRPELCSHNRDFIWNCCFALLLRLRRH